MKLTNLYKNLAPLFIAIMTMAFGQVAQAKKTAPNREPNGACSKKLGGNWEFGRAPYGCAMDPSILAPLQSKYPHLVYDDKKAKKEEASRFTTEMYDFLSDSSRAYFKRRSPNASEADLAEWNRLILSTTHQESFWTHFRKGKDGIFRFFKGDSHHGLGLMQIDDRWHKQFIKTNKVYDLNGNFIYAMDMLYELREKAIRKPCSGKKDGKSISRSTYSSYNGGPNQKCRWLKTGSKWARNDKNFLAKYNAKSWEGLVR